MTETHSEILEDEDFDTIFAKEIEFDGELVFERSFLVRGKLSGTVKTQGILLVDEGALVNADIRADKVIIRGMVDGNVDAACRVEITSTGKLNGNISTPELLLESGCLFNGSCTMPEQSVK
jgi:cytoskeletal protein CcmA (bactofilin family)